MKKKKPIKSQKKQTGIIWLVAAIIILLVAIVVVFISKTTNTQGDVIENELCNEENQDWINENCECVSYEGGEIVCPEGYEVDGEVCKKGNKITNQMQECSKYKCEFEINR